MIVFDLHCADCAYVYEAWFGSSSAFEEQVERGLVACPACGGGNVAKAPMSPRVPAKSNQSTQARSSQPEMDESRIAVEMASGNEAGVAKLRQLTEQLAKAQSEMLKGSEWVGSDFANKARAMHYGETEGRPIHGEVSVADAKALVEEGVKAAPLPFPVIPPKLQN